jgi:hypothetical protein
VVDELIIGTVETMVTKVAEQQTTFRDAKGSTVGRAVPQGDGSVRCYDAQGKSLGTSTTDGSVTRHYGPDGRSLGRSYGPARPSFPERR